MVAANTCVELWFAFAYYFGVVWMREKERTDKERNVQMTGKETEKVAGPDTHTHTHTHRAIKRDRAREGAKDRERRDKKAKDRQKVFGCCQDRIGGDQRIKQGILDGSRKCMTFLVLLTPENARSVTCKFEAGIHTHTHTERE